MTTREFLSHFGFETLRDLRDMEVREDAGLLSEDRVLAGDIPLALTVGDGDDAELDEEVLAEEKN